MTNGLIETIKGLRALDKLQSEVIKLEKFIVWLSGLIVVAIISFFCVDCFGGRATTEVGEVFDEIMIPAHYQEYIDHIYVKSGKTTMDIPVPKQRYIPVQYFLVINSKSISGMKVSVSWLKYCNTHPGDKVPIYFKIGKYTGCQYSKQISTELLTES